MSAGQSGGVSIPGTVGHVAGDIVGGNKITMARPPKNWSRFWRLKGFSGQPKRGGLERQTIIKLAQRLKPEVLDFDQAVRELERACSVALDVIARGERGTNHDEFVNAVLAQVAEKTRIGDLDGGASTIDDGLAELDAGASESAGRLARSRA